MKELKDFIANEVYCKQYGHFIDDKTSFLEFLSKKPKEGVFIGTCMMCYRTLSCNVDIGGTDPDTGKLDVEVLLPDDEEHCRVKPEGKC